MFITRNGKSFNPTGVELGKIKETEESLAWWKSRKPVKTIERDHKLNLQSTHKRAGEIGFVGALALTLGFSFAMRSYAPESKSFDFVPEELIVEQIPPTEQIVRPPVPERPAIPIPSEDDEIPEDETIHFAEIDFEDIPPPPDAPAETVEESFIFVEYDTPPKPIGGMSALYKNLVYPSIARKAGIEGLVIVTVLVNEQGTVERASVLKGTGSKVGFEDAAVAAVQDVKWSPAMQRDRPVKVEINIPIRFKLKATTT